MANLKAQDSAAYSDAGLKGHKAIWDHIVAHGGQFNISDIEQKTNVHRNTVRDYVKRLVRAGYADVEDIDGIKHYRLLKKSFEAPRLRRDGKPSVAHGTVNDQMWRSMKMMSRFNKHDLAIHASTISAPVKVTTAESYIKLLCRAGYLQCVKESKPGKAAEYVFLKSKNTGFRAPMIQRTKSVFDPNLKKVVWVQKSEVCHDGA